MSQDPNRILLEGELKKTRNTDPAKVVADKVRWQRRRCELSYRQLSYFKGSSVSAVGRRGGGRVGWTIGGERARRRRVTGAEGRGGSWLSSCIAEGAEEGEERRGRGERRGRERGRKRERRKSHRERKKRGTIAANSAQRKQKRTDNERREKDTEGEKRVRGESP